MKYIKNSLLFFSYLFLYFLFTSSAPKYSVISINSETYNEDRTITADKIIFKKGGLVRINNGATVTFDATTIEIEGRFTINGKGNSGSKKVGDWDSKGTCKYVWGQCQNCHKDWQDACNGHNQNDKGGAGGRGATVNIHYDNISGIRGGFDNLYIDVSGGDGGQGRTLRCGCSDHSEVCYGDTGDSGSDGLWTIY